MGHTRAQALAAIEEGHREVAELLASIGDEDLARPGTIGDGDWSAKDLAVHLAEWESHAVRAIEAWRRGERPDVLDLTGDAIETANAEAVAAHRPHPPRAARRRFESAYGDLVAAIDAVTNDEWDAPLAFPTPRPMTLGDLVGGVLAGPAGEFDHAADHLDDLRAYAGSLRTKA
ncbi:MAG: maleylpyruvate isomerase N-terminal domain-containing protein [Actinomycetota bacterium]